MPEPGDQIGAYRLVRQLGSGGMGVVFAAIDDARQSHVALKFIEFKNRDSPLMVGAQRRFRREARVLAGLAHPGIVAFQEIGEHDGVLYLAMELVDGVSLSTWRTQALRSWQEVLSVMVPVGAALAACHGANIVHRDLKPPNILITPTGVAKVLDFGLAKVTQTDAEWVTSVEDTGAASLTHPGLVLGTLPYVSPQTLQGQECRLTCDQFVFCTCLFEALFGEVPYAGTSAMRLFENMMEEDVRVPPATTDVPDWLHEILLRGLRYDPEARFENMRALLSAIDARHSVLALW